MLTRLEHSSTKEAEKIYPISKGKEKMTDPLVFVCWLFKALR